MSQWSAWCSGALLVQYCVCKVNTDLCVIVMFPLQHYSLDQFPSISLTCTWSCKLVSSIMALRKKQNSLPPSPYCSS